jgi:hypothetical protein
VTMTGPQVPLAQNVKGCLNVSLTVPDWQMNLQASFTQLNRTKQSDAIHFS